MVEITIDGNVYEAEEGATILEVAREHRVDIPTCATCARSTRSARAAYASWRSRASTTSWPHATTKSRMAWWSTPTRRACGAPAWQTCSSSFRGTIDAAHVLPQRNLPAASAYRPHGRPRGALYHVLRDQAHRRAVPARTRAREMRELPALRIHMPEGASARRLGPRGLRKPRACGRRGSRRLRFLRPMHRQLPHGCTARARRHRARLRCDL